MSKARSSEQGYSLAELARYIIKLETDTKVAIAHLSSGTPGPETALQTITSKLRSLVNEDEKLQIDLMKPHPGVPLQKSSGEMGINHDIGSMMLDMAALNTYAIQTQADWLNNS